jgi:hypothetical protein
MACQGYGNKMLSANMSLDSYGMDKLPPFSQGDGFKFIKFNLGNKIKYLVQKDGTPSNFSQGETANGVLYYRVYELDGTRDCEYASDADWENDKKYKNDEFDKAFQIWAKNQPNGGGPRPKKTKKKAVLPDGKIYDLFKSGNKWYVERECQSGTKKLVLVHPKK